MKFPTKDEMHDYGLAISIGGLQGGAVGGMAAYFLSRFVNKRYPTFRTYGAFPRTFLWLVPIIGCGVTSMEFASRRFEASRYGYIAESDILKRRKQEEGSPTHQLKTFLVEKKYHLIGAAWAASMVGSWVVINRDKFMTKSQKIVQARMAAQGITVVLLLTSMLVSVNDISPANKPKEQWENLVEEETKREEAAHLPLHLSERHLKEQHSKQKTE